MLTVKTLRSENILHRDHHDGERIYRVDTVGVFENDALVRTERHSFWYDNRGKMTRVTSGNGPSVETMTDWMDRQAKNKAAVKMAS